MANETEPDDLYLSIYIYIIYIDIYVHLEKEYICGHVQFD